MHVPVSRVYVFRAPVVEEYSDEQSFGPGETLAPSAFPNDPIDVASILP